MIVERESVMSEADLKNERWFPRYIVVRKEAESEASQSGAGEWRGFVKDIKNGFERTVGKLKEEVQRENMQNADMILKVREEVAGVKQDIKDLEGRLL